MDKEESEAAAIRSLLDGYDATETLEWLPPLDSALEIPVLGAEELQLAPGDNNPPPALPFVSVPARRSDIDEHEKPLSDAGRLRAKQTDPNRARNERRLELIHLRRQAAELENHLGKLNRVDAATWSSRSTAGDVRPSQSILCVADGLYPYQRSVELWEELARDEKNKRLRAETENTRLRLLVGSHVKTANQLRRILMPKRARNARSYLSACFQEHGCDEQTKRLPSRAFPTDRVSASSVVPGPATVTAFLPSLASNTDGSGLSSSQVFEILKHSVSSARRDMDAVFIANGLATMEKTYRSAKVEQDDEDGTTMELAASKVLPYDLESTKRVAWRHFVDSHPKLPDRTSFQFRDERKVCMLSCVYPA